MAAAQAMHTVVLIKHLVFSADATSLMMMMFS
jgi:hypothetical protein